MSWNYRVIATQEDTPFDGCVITWGIHGVYYDNLGNIEAWTEKRMAPFGETLEKLHKDVYTQKRAFSRTFLTIIVGDSVEKTLERWNSLHDALHDDLDELED